MPWWYFEKEELKNTPSRKDNVEFDTERRYRRYVNNIILNQLMMKLQVY